MSAGLVLWWCRVLVVVEGLGWPGLGWWEPVEVGVQVLELISPVR